MVNVFSVPLFFIAFRETLEASIIISVLLAFLKQGLGHPDQDRKLYKRLVWQVWIGSIIGIFICLCIGGAFIGVFYSLGKDIWSQSEDLWEGIFSIIACAMITVMGFAMLRLNKMKEKWRVKIAKSLLGAEQDRQLGNKRSWWAKLRPSSWSTKYAMLILPLVTTLREGVELIVFIGGVSLGTPATAFPIPIITGIFCGCLVGYVIYRGGNIMSIQIFLIVSTCFLYLISAGLFSKAIWYFQMYAFSKKTGGDVAESGSGPGSYNIKQSVWHVNCCNPETDNGWEIFNALFGWQNSATYGSVISYNIYWLFIIITFLGMLYAEKKGLSLPFIGRFQKKAVSRREADDMVRQAQETTKRLGQSTAVNTTHDSDDVEKGGVSPTNLSVRQNSN